MARTPENENIIRSENATQASEANSAYQDTQNYLQQYQNNMGTLERGGEVGADPYQTASYLGNENRLVGDATSGAAAGGRQQLEMQNRRSGGQNTGATIAGITNLTGSAGRLNANLLAGQRSQDYSKNLQFQQYLAGAPLSAANAESSLFGTATTGEDSTAGDMSQYALQQQKEQEQQLQQAEKLAELAGAAGLTVATGGAAAPVLIGGLAANAKS